MPQLSEEQTKQLNGYFEKTTEVCMEAFETPRADDPVRLATEIMALEGYPMHYPTHHYLVPAVLLAAVRKKQGHGPDVLRRDLEEALERAKAVPGGFCGFQGTCGAAVGVGIFWSVITDTIPTSKASWGYGNRATGLALLKMAEYGGPRCCKRCSYLSLLSALPQIAERLKVEISAETPECAFYKQNQDECLKKGCPFYPAQPCQ